MEKEMTGADRRKEILSMIRDTDTPVSGTAIGRKTGVSRQVVVQDCTSPHTGVSDYFYCKRLSAG